MDDRKKKKTKTSKKQTKKETISETDQNEQPAGQQAANPAFEQAAQVIVPPKEKRGGVREPVGGRPLGLTDEKAKVKNLPQYPSNPIKQGVQSLFDLWAAAAKIEQLALSEDEADNLSLPLTQLQEYYFPGILPEIAGTWIMMIFAVTRIVKPRINMVNEARRQRKAAREGKVVPAGGIAHYKETFGLPYHAITPGEIVTFTNIVADVTCPTCLKILKEKASVN